MSPRARYRGWCIKEWWCIIDRWMTVVMPFSKFGINLPLLPFQNSDSWRAEMAIAILPLASGEFGEFCPQHYLEDFTGRADISTWKRFVCMAFPLVPSANLRHIANGVRLENAWWELKAVWRDAQMVCTFL